jgi:hypothetical protein
VALSPRRIVYGMRRLRGSGRNGEDCSGVVFMTLQELSYPLRQEPSRCASDINFVNSACPQHTPSTRDASERHDIIGRQPIKYALTYRSNGAWKRLVSNQRRSERKRRPPKGRRLENVTEFADYLRGFSAVGPQCRTPQERFRARSKRRAPALHWYSRDPRPAAHSCRTSGRSNWL